MAIGIGNLGQIVEDFTSSVTQAFGGSTAGDPSGKGGTTISLFNPEFGGSSKLEQENWRGNAGTSKKAVRYGFATLTGVNVSAASSGNSSSSNDSEPFNDIYYLDIPPQALKQKEIFSNNIQATRKGIIVETEGVIFKDIIIRGTTGIYPGPRGSANNPQANFSDFTAPPKAPAGVDAASGKSLDGTTQVLSGYEEFLRLRQFFLRYAKLKVEQNGDLFLVFINEKDNQFLLVEPLEFEMDRDSKSPLTYQYNIMLKCIGNIDDVFGQAGLQGGDPNNLSSTLEDIGNASANISAAIQQSRVVINQSRQLLERVSQSIDGTFINPLRQVQFAMDDLSDGVSTVLSLPGILAGNVNSAVLDIRESIDDIGNSVNNFIGGDSSAGEFTTARTVQARIETDSRSPVPRSSIQTLNSTNTSLSNNLADAFNLGSTEFDALEGRTPTIIPSPIKQVTDQEFLLLGSLNDVQDALNRSLSNNGFYEAEAEEYFNQAQQQLQNIVTLPTPTSVREVQVIQGDTLERIAQRELGSADRWLEIMVLNNLKSPYLDAMRRKNVIAFGDNILVPES